MKTETKQYKNIKVHYTKELMGGGSTFGQQYTEAVKNTLGKVNTVCEMCAGCGFIGFSLLAEGLCKELVLSDINPKVIKMLKKTAKENGLNTPKNNGDKPPVRIYQSDGMKNIPETEKFDLVVGNPPHFKKDTKQGLLTNDIDWKMHKDFYRNIKKHLTKNGTILLQENYAGSEEKDFLDMIKKNDLIFLGSFMVKLNIKNTVNPYYFMIIKPKNNMIYNDEPTTEIELEYPFKEIINPEFPKDKTGEKLILKENKKYRIKVKNNSENAIEVGLKNKDREFFHLTKLLNAEGHQIGQSPIMCLTEGEFELFIKKDSIKINVKK